MLCEEETSSNKNRKPVVEMASDVLSRIPASAFLLLPPSKPEGFTVAVPTVSLLLLRIRSG